MRYRVGMVPDRGDYRAMVAADFGYWGPEADDADSSNRLSRLTMRHARAMLEVQRAARAYVRAFAALEAAFAEDEFVLTAAKKGQAEGAARRRLNAAVAKLEAVEKEVRRG